MNYIKKITFLLFFVLLNNALEADVAHGVLEKYKNNNIFICTGIYSCVSLARALNAGFTELHGIDENDVLVDHARIIFPHDINNNPYNVKNYNFHLGGLEKLEAVISHINTPITFLLSSCFPDMDGTTTNRILDELEIIKRHPIKRHTILVEYVNYAGTSRFGNISLDAIKAKLLAINPYYKFSLEKGGILEKEENAILVAYH